MGNGKSATITDQKFFRAIVFCVGSKIVNVGGKVMYSTIVENSWLHEGLRGGKVFSKLKVREWTLGADVTYTMATITDKRVKVTMMKLFL